MIAPAPSTIAPTQSQVEKRDRHRRPASLVTAYSPAASTPHDGKHAELAADEAAEQAERDGQDDPDRPAAGERVGQGQERAGRVRDS